ncbi:hypothetical protein [Oceanobacillus sp. AG]|uniref:Uncharacterized protein n=1 Tax=Oceanobacillus indicireducens TaxID=1004261 RepID=A0A917Y0Z5_9BACI|nr:hypothetical protein [Oceanobacillus sp. AG]GGN60249.1 hypothetical protein GCM10007971_24170 [Oceanobacillus indicireducens]
MQAQFAIRFAGAWDSAALLVPSKDLLVAWRRVDAADAVNTNNLQP